MSISARIRTLMEERSIRQKTLAATLNIPLSTFNGYMTERCQFPCEVVAQVARELNTTTDYLLGIQAHAAPPLCVSDNEEKMIKAMRALSPKQQDLIVRNIYFMLEQNES